MDRVAQLGVVTVTYNSADVLKEFFDSVFAQTFKDFVLYVVDNASKDHSVELASKCHDPRIRIIENECNLGVAEGNNRGIRLALADGCESVLLLNNDTVFPPEVFSQLAKGLDQQQCAMTTPKIYYHDTPNKIWAAGGSFQPSLGYRVRHYGMGQDDKGQFDECRSVAYTPTCCVLIRRGVFEQIGLMDPHYFVYLDDVDFMFRAMKAGFVLKYLPHCRLWHKVSSLAGHMSEFQERYCARNRSYFLRRNLPNWQALIWRDLYRLYYTARVLTRWDSVSTWRLKMSSSLEGWGIYRG